MNKKITLGLLVGAVVITGGTVAYGDVRDSAQTATALPVASTPSSTPHVFYSPSVSPSPVQSVAAQITRAVRSAVPLLHPPTTKPKPVTKPTTHAPRPTPRPSTKPAGRIVHPGSFCQPLGSSGITASGRPMRCSSPDGKQPRWRSA